MTKKTTALEVLPEGRAKSELEKSKREVLALLPTEALERITTPEQYEAADYMLGKVRKARGAWGLIWKRIQEKSIQPIRAGLEELYQTNRDVDGPMEKMEAAIKIEMKAFKQRELEGIRAVERAQQEEANRLHREAAAAEARAKTAPTPQIRGRLLAQSERAKSQAEEVEQQEAPLPVMAASSSTRTIKKWRVDDLTAFIAAVADGTLNEDCLSVNSKAMDIYFKEDPEGMQAWPGVVVYDDVQIVGR